MRPRPHLEALPPYQPVEPLEILAERLGRPLEEIVKLDANENPYGPTPAVLEALSRLPFLHIYPDSSSHALRLALAAFTGTPAEFLLAGAGADELIDLLMRVMLDPGDKVLNCPPTFGMYAFDAGVHHARLIQVPRRADFSLDIEGIGAAVAREQPSLLFLSTPNNPDGSLPPRETLEALLELPVLVVLDEAYIEFSDEALGRSHTLIGEVPQRENLVVLRTFSKWAGLAGLRVGYGAFPRWLLPTLWKARQPYTVNVAASLAARLSLEHLDERQAVVQRIREERERLFIQLQAIPYLQPYPSQANFILCRVHGVNAAALRDWLARRHGILVRYFDKPGLQDCIRISVGRPQDSERLLEALREFEKEG
uniref:Histidinol-phosphate aminotransferase n=1 Tax=uncultured Chloroflexota bacterium TaxID=166587 RepID=H5SBG6_9CHLR|nr:hypothetical conserved protein [uncultured Chloroflexota bacterium]